MSRSMTGWEGWNTIGLALFRATGGSDRGFDIFDKWSKKNTVKYNAKYTHYSWYRRYVTCPPTMIGAGTLFVLADQEQPGWRQIWDYENPDQLAEQTDGEQDDDAEQPADGEQDNPTVDPAAAIPPAPPPKGDDKIILKMNRRHAAVSVNGKYRVMTWLPHSKFPLQHFAEFSAKADFCNIHEYPKVEFTVTENSKTKTVKMGRGIYFLNHSGHLRYDGIEFAPGSPPIIKRTDREGHVTHYANMYSGFSVKPKQGDCSLYLAHLHDNICGGDELLYNYNLDWMASGVQHPNDPARTAISMRGDPGVGKGIGVTEYGKIFGRHFLHLTNSEQLTGRFNALSAQSLLIFADEAMFAGDRKAAQILKTLVSERDKILELKGIDSFMIPNYGRLIFSTNDEHPLRTEVKDRRYVSIYVQPNHIRDRPYFVAIIDQMANGGRAALLYFLLQRDISNFNPEAIPSSNEMFKQKIASASVGDRVIIGFAQDGCLPGAMVDVDGQRRDRPWVARGRGPGFLFDEMKRRGGRDMQYLDEVALTDLLKEWGFSRKPLGNQIGWQALPLLELRKKLVEKYPGLQWDNPDIIEWGAVTATEQTEQGPTGDVYTDYAREYAREQSRKHAHNIHRTRPK